MFCIVLKKIICLHCQIKKQHYSNKKINKMKNKHSNFLRTLNHLEITNGSLETKTLGTPETNLTQVKQVFNSVDLWNIQRNSKTGFARRRVNTLCW